MTDILSKKTIRREALLHRDRLTPNTEDPELAARWFLEALRPAPENIIGLYWPKGREFDCLPLMHELLQGGWICSLPVIQGEERILKFSSYRDGDELAEGPFGLLQPASGKWVDPDIFVIPLLAFDRHGHRLGYGKGYYDATLAHYRASKKVTAVGYGFGEQAVLFNLPVDLTDQKLDWMITPQQAIKFDRDKRLERN